MKKVKIGLLLVMLCIASVFAQEVAPPAPEVPATVSALATVPATVADSAKAMDSAAVAKVAEEAPKVVEETPKVAEQIPATPEPPVPSVEQAAAVQPAPVALPPAPAIAKEPLDIKFHLGIRSALGVSALRGHKALKLLDSPHAIRLEPAFSLGGGIAFAIEINSVFTLAPELQYNWYRANGEFVKENGTDFRDLHEAGASLHSFELPILARFSFSSVYIELGPQAGYNYYAKIYNDSEFKKPKINPFAFGPSLGVGASINGILVGIRGHFGVLEYAKNTKGYPWAAQVSLTQFFF
jgi:hypothetical protein